MKVEPRIPGFAECLWFSRVRLVVCQLAGNYNSMRFREDNAVDVVVGRVLRFLSNGLDGVMYILSGC